MQKFSFFNQLEANLYFFLHLLIIHFKFILSWFEGFQLNLANKYCNIMTTLWFTAFYAPIHPVLPLISALCLVLNYWADKVSSCFSRKISFIFSTAFLEDIQDHHFSVPFLMMLCLIF